MAQIALVATSKKLFKCRQKSKLLGQALCAK